MFVRDGICLNRQSEPYSKLLSVATHGTRLVFTDANGYIKWVERDGRTEVRRWNLTKNTKYRRRRLGLTHSIPPSLHDSESYRWVDESAAGVSDIVRKILPTGYNYVLDDELLIWTGDRIGRLHFSNKARQDWDNEAEIYEEQMESARREEERKLDIDTEAASRSPRAN